jgi:hypothetical protein
MEILSYFLTSSLQLAFDSPAESLGRSPWSAAFPRPRDEADSAGTTECAGRWWGNERMGLWDVCDFI